MNYTFEYKQGRKRNFFLRARGNILLRENHKRMRIHSNCWNRADRYRIHSKQTDINW